MKDYQSLIFKINCKGTLRVFSFLFVAFLCIQTVTLSSIYGEEESPNIMIIHSYDLSYQWTNKQDDGLRTSILEAYPKANIYTEILDAKRISEAYIMTTQKEVFIEKYSESNIDLFLATDDIALEFAIQAREGLNIDIPIGFSGILEGAVDALVEDANKVTGVFEIREFGRMIELMNLLQPDVEKIVVINDLSSSSQQLVEKVITEFEEKGIKDNYIFESWQDKTYADILEDVSRLEDKTAVFLISYHQSADGVIKSGEAICNEISSVSKAPMYSLGELYFGEGLIGGEFLSGRLQGEELGAIAIEILKGKNAEDIPYSSKSTSYLGIDENMTRKFGVDKIQLPEDAIVINEEFTFYEMYTELVWFLLIIFTILIIFIAVLMRQKHIIDSKNNTLVAQKDKLQGLFEQVTSSEEELQAQNEELLFYQNELKFRAEHDQLTGLYNRFSLEEYVKHIMENSQISTKFIVVFIDLDNFKYINNNHGHHVGDLILIQISKRLLALDENFYISRVGGDEFVLINQYSSEDNSQVIEYVLSQLKKVFAIPVKVEHDLIQVNASIGYSLYPEDGQDYDEIIAFADIAMYEAKRKQKGSAMRYTQNFEKLFDKEYKMINEIYKGIENDEFYLVFQPIMTIDGSQINSFEALLRWNSSCYGPVSPIEFIHIAEASGQILALGDKVIDLSIEFIKMIETKSLEIKNLSINISVIQFYESDFVTKLMTKLNDHHIDPSLIQLEIVESMMIHSYEMIYDKLEELKANGITIALDDFGTGYSSLSHIDRLPIDIIKVDKQFVDDILLEKEGKLIIDSIFALTKSLSLKSIAEGVETLEQVEYVKKCGCDYIQGYYYSKPLEVHKAIEFLEKYT